MNIDKTLNVQMPIEFLPKQLKVLSHTDTHRAVLYSGAFRSGKTLLLAHAAVMKCLENAGIKGMLLSQTNNQLKGVVFELVVEAIEMYQKELRAAGINLELAASITRSSGNMEITFYNGSKILFRPCRTREEQRKLAGYTLDFFGLDEPVDMDEEVFNQLTGRISGTRNLKNTFGLLTTNPETEFHWLYFKFFIEKFKGYVAVETSTYDNELLPNYSTYIEEKEQQYGEDWVNRYLKGHWGAFEGQIFKGFNPKRHVSDVVELPVKYHICGVDWGLRHAYVVLVAGVTNDNRLIIKEERYGNNKSTPEVAQIVKNLNKEYKFKKIYGDPSNPDLIMQMYNLGLPSGKRRDREIVSYAENDVQKSITKLQSFFKHDNILIDFECSHLRTELPAYKYKEGTDKPIKQNDDAIDALRYLITDYDPFHGSSGFEVLHYLYNKWG